MLKLDFVTILIKIQFLFKERKKIDIQNSHISVSPTDIFRCHKIIDSIIYKYNIYYKKELYL